MRANGCLGIICDIVLASVFLASTHATRCLISNNLFAERIFVRLVELTQGMAFLMIS